MEGQLGASALACLALVSSHSGRQSAKVGVGTGRSMLYPAFQLSHFHILPQKADERLRYCDAGGCT